MLKHSVAPAVNSSSPSMGNQKFPYIIQLYIVGISIAVASEDYDDMPHLSTNLLIEFDF